MSKRAKGDIVAGRSHTDRKSFFERYQQEAKKSASIDRFALHLNADGLTAFVTCGGRTLPETLPELRELMIQSRVGELNELHWTATEKVGEYRMTREHAEQIADTMLGVWPPTRILCCATEKALHNLEAKFGPLPSRYYEPTDLPIAA